MLLAPALHFARMDEDFTEGLDDRHMAELKERVRRSPFHQWAGLELVDAADGTAELRMDLLPHHFNPQGIVHGGIITAIADTSIGLALRSQLRAGYTHRTAQLNVLTALAFPIVAKSGRQISDVGEARLVLRASWMLTARGFAPARHGPSDRGIPTRPRAKAGPS